jgi:c-di-GMP-related signal transduction protein
LRYLNSPIFAFSSEIRLVAAVGAAQKKSSERVLLALMRARFCELLATRVQHGDSDLFFLRLSSLMDVILEIPMLRLLERVPADHENKVVLPGEPTARDRFLNS